MSWPGAQGRDHHEHDHGQDVLHDQPSDRHVSCGSRHELPRLQPPQQHDRARHRQRDAEHDAGGDRPSEGHRDGHPEQRRHHALDEGARNGHALHVHQLAKVEVEADAEHQEDDAHLRELARERHVADEARRVGTDQDAGQQVTDDGREA